MKLIQSVILLLLLSWGNLSALTLHYLTTFEDGTQRRTSTTVIPDGDGFLIYEDTPDGNISYEADGQGSVFSLLVHDEDGTLRRSGEFDCDRIYYEDHKNSARNKTIRAPSGHWYQPMGVSLSFFIRSDAQSIDYTVMNLDTTKSVNLKATKTRIETISSSGKEYEALLVKVRPSGALALFWSSKHWFDPETGFLLRFEGTSGPGTPSKIMELTGIDYEENIRSTGLDNDADETAFLSDYGNYVIIPL